MRSMSVPCVEHGQIDGQRFASVCAVTFGAPGTAFAPHAGAFTQGTCVALRQTWQGMAKIGIYPFARPFTAMLLCMSEGNTNGARSRARP